MRAVRPGTGSADIQEILDRRLTNAMNVLILTIVLDLWQIIIHNVHHVSDVKSSTRHSSSNEDWGCSFSECSATESQCEFIRSESKYVHRVFTLALSAVSVNRSTWETQVEEVIVHEISRLLGLDKDQSSCWW